MYVYLHRIRIRCGIRIGVAFQRKMKMVNQKSKREKVKQQSCCCLFFSNCKIFHHERTLACLCECKFGWLQASQPASLFVDVSVFVRFRFECVFDIWCDCIRVSSVANSPLLYFVQASRRTQHTKSMCCIYHPSIHLWFLCVREMRMALCAWRTITKTHGEEFIFHSLTHTRTYSVARSQCEMYCSC